MSDSRPSLIISAARCGLYVISGGVTAAIDADSTITAGCGLPPVTLAGTYGTNRFPLGSESSGSSALGGDGSTKCLSASQASSSVAALPQLICFSCSCQFVPGVAPVLSITRICTLGAAPYFAYSFPSRVRFARILHRQAIRCHHSLKLGWWKLIASLTIATK